METTAAFTGLSCVDCGESFDAETVTHQCPDCGGILDATYDYNAIDADRETFASRRGGQFRWAELLPFGPEAAVTMHEGDTPLVPAPRLTEELGVARVFVKDEGRNPTGSVRDRGQALAVTAAVHRGAEDVALASAGNAGQSAAAYATRAGLDSHVFLPSRSSFVNKAMVNVHGGDMSIVEGRIGDAGAAYEDAMEANPDWYSLQTFITPYRHEAKKTVYYEIAEQLDWETPDHVVYPTGSGVGLVGMYKAAQEFADLGFTEDGPELPAFWAAQSEGCAPVAKAFEEGKDVHEVWEVPDSICGGIEIPDPGASPWILEAIRESDGGAVATSDEDIMSSTATVAQNEGLEMGVSCSAAASGAWKLAREGAFDEDDTVVLMNTATGNKDADVARSHLMSKGI
jgi:threonine synthase